MHFGIANAIFLVLLGVTGFVAFKKYASLIRNIRLGKSLDRNDRFGDRLNVMFRVALGQSKMVVRPVAGIMHIFVYVGFIIINVELLEIVIDGIFGTHRAFSFLGPVYTILINSFEILAVLVILGCVVFFARRNLVKLKRFNMKELMGWPRNDANIILITEVCLMSAFLIMNSADWFLSTQLNNFPDVVKHYGLEHYANSGVSENAFLITPWISGWMPAPNYMVFIERFCWWFHIIGICGFIMYLPYSKHLHILFAFPNVFYSNLEPKGKFNNLESITNEVKAVFDPSFTPPADAVPGKFGAKDVADLTWKQLLDAYTCTECGRCTSVCPANTTGKLLSPRKIMMSTRDRLEEVGRGLDAQGAEFKDEKALLHDYITPEELWACTSCNACTEACPVNIDPLSIIVDLRRYLVMEESAPPSELATVFANMENNGAPWQFSPADRLNWAHEN